LTISYGFMERPDIPRALALLRAGGFRLNLMETSFFVGREALVSRKHSGVVLPFKKLFMLLSKLSLRATDFFRLPAGRIVELGGEIDI
jgi:KUP system potassium uptake protein